MVRGRPPNHERRRLVATLRAQGLTFAEIGQSGISYGCYGRFPSVILARYNL
jgi:hypothetical protein